jgi:hypothetical protein
MFKRHHASTHTLGSSLQGCPAVCVCVSTLRVHAMYRIHVSSLTLSCYIGNTMPTGGMIGHGRGLGRCGRTLAGGMVTPWPPTGEALAISNQP